mmetsp:Transcript_19493/g.30951  ORF Transcript_19493/g.30951 Transcript_19493/m.30951 type:complete len:284 (+) Transcript_19493:672-1523(+)
MVVSRCLYTVAGSSDCNCDCGCAFCDCPIFPHCTFGCGCGCCGCDCAAGADSTLPGFLLALSSAVPSSNDNDNPPPDDQVAFDSSFFPFLLLLLSSLVAEVATLAPQLNALLSAAAPLDFLPASSCASNAGGVVVNPTTSCVLCSADFNFACGFGTIVCCCFTGDAFFSFAFDVRSELCSVLFGVNDNGLLSALMGDFFSGENSLKSNGFCGGLYGGVLNRAARRRSLRLTVPNPGVLVYSKLVAFCCRMLAAVSPFCARDKCLSDASLFNDCGLRADLHGVC